MTGDLDHRSELTLEGADALAAAAEAEASARGARVVIVVADGHGRPLVLRRLDGTQVASVAVGIDKARTAAIFRRPSRELEEQVAGGRIGALGLHGAAPLTGGVPVIVDGQAVGAVGVSGETPDVDEAVAIAGAAAALAGHVARVAVLTQRGAQRVADAAQSLAVARGVAPVVAVVDEGGVPIVLGRLDGAQVASVDVAVDKARTAAIFRRPSGDFEDQVAQGRVAALALHGATPLRGGLPLVVEGRVVGGIGVSGASSAPQDSEIAEAGAAALAGGAAAPEGFYLGAGEAAAAFARGGLLFGGPAYKLDAGRRTAPGEVECHRDVTDLMYVLEGTATVVVGGEMVEPREVAPGELRAASSTGGEARHLEPGAVLAIPAGVPHWFTEVPGPLGYYVVKVVS